MSTQYKPITAITMGDPAGIGPEIVVGTMLSEEIHDCCRPFVIGSIAIMERAAKVLGKELKYNKIEDPSEAKYEFGTVDIIETGDYDTDSIEWGKVQALAGRMAVDWIMKSIELGQAGKIDAVSTAPIHKGAIKLIGVKEPGHTEIYQNATHSPYALTMFSCHKLRVAVVVPAMPQSRRILVGGYSVIDGVALINTPVAQDVRTPVKENYIPRLLAGQTRRKVGLVTLDQVLKGKEGIKEALTEVRNDGAGVIIVDAITLEDVDQIAQACIDLDWDVVAVDPGPFTSKLAYRRGLIQEEQPNVPPAASEEGKTVLIAAGSATPVTKKQMQVLCEDSRHVRISVEPIPLINGGDEALDEAFKAVNKAVELIESDKQPRAILFETALHGELLNLDEEDKKRGYAGGMSANRINAGLGTIISPVLEQVGREKIAGLYTTGGDTMVNVCYQLGVECIEVMDYVIPQTDVGRLVGKYDGLPVVGKGGLTGNDNTACDIVERLFKESAR